MTEQTPNVRASLEQAATRPRHPRAAPTMTDLPCQLRIVVLLDCGVKALKSTRKKRSVLRSPYAHKVRISATPATVRLPTTRSSRSSSALTVRGNGSASNVTWYLSA